MLIWRVETFENNNWLLEVNNLVLTVVCGRCIAHPKPRQGRYLGVGQIRNLHKLQQRFGRYGVLTSILCKLQPLSWQIS